MKLSKSKSIATLVIVFVITVALAALSYFGIGSTHLMGVQNIRQGLDLQGGVSIKFEADAESPSLADMQTAESLLRDRLDRRGWTEAEVAIEGGNRLMVNIPGVEDAETAISEIGQTAMLYFVDMDGNVILDGTMVKSATSHVGQTSDKGPVEAYVKLEFDDLGRQYFAEGTRNNIGKQIAIVLDEEAISAPTVQAEITDGTAIISGSFDAKSAEELAALIRAGGLPFDLKVMDRSSVGARLGSEALETSIVAGFVGFLLVVVFMMIMYRVSGIVADWALIIYVCLELIVLSILGVTLTLPGIAGIILSIGMAVDANVIIFERINEEVRLGKTLLASIEAGFSRAFPSILDGNVTTLIAAVILYFLGTGPIKGFAQTLIIGIILSMFTALFVTKTIMRSFVGVGLKKVSVLNINAGANAKEVK